MMHEAITIENIAKEQRQYTPDIDPTRVSWWYLEGMRDVLAGSKIWNFTSPASEEIMEAYLMGWLDAGGKI